VSDVEYSWFSALCDDDYEQLGVPRPELLSSFPHCRDIVLAAEAGGFDNVLLPSGYTLGIDAVAFAAAVAPLTSRIRLLVAVRCGETWPPQLARQLATLNEVLAGRLTINVISSEMPGETLGGAERYARTAETMVALRTLMSGESLHLRGEHYSLDVEPPRILSGPRTPPPLYFGGLSEEARAVAARHADVYLMWPETRDGVASIVGDMTRRAAEHGRTLRFGYRVHVVVRDTEDEARAAARHLVAAVDAATGDAIRARSLDSNSVGVRRQAELRESAADDGFVEPHLWTGIGAARSGCGAALVGTPAQVADKLRDYVSLGIDSFILSGYPHLEECRRFATSVLPLLRDQAD